MLLGEIYDYLIKTWPPESPYAFRASKLKIVFYDGDVNMYDYGNNKPPGYATYSYVFCLAAT